MVFSFSFLSLVVFDLDVAVSCFPVGPCLWLIMVLSVILISLHLEVCPSACSSVNIFSSPGRSPGRAIVLPPASALALAPALAKC